MMSNQDRLVYMANQIARNLEAQGHDHAVDATAEHIDLYWNGRMRSQIFACLDEKDNGLIPTAEAAIRQLLEHDAPVPPQTRATVINAVDEVGRSDAG